MLLQEPWPDFYKTWLLSHIKEKPLQAGASGVEGDGQTVM